VIEVRFDRGFSHPSAADPFEPAKLEEEPSSRMTSERQANRCPWANMDDGVG